MLSKSRWFGLPGAPPRLAVGTALLLTGACGPAVREPVAYSGSQQVAQVSAAQLVSVATLPVGYEVFGQLQAECNAWDEGSPVDDQWLIDLDCNERRLRGALREKAAAVGGTLLVRERCGSGQRANPGSSGAEAGAGPLVCRARVARLDGSERARAPLSPELARSSDGPELAAGPTQAAGLDDPTGVAAWKIRVSYTGRSPVGVTPVSIIPASAVHEWPEVPPSHQAVGTIVTNCSEGCTLDAMRASVRVVAGRLGAGDVAGVRCVPRGEAWSCVGRVALAWSKGG